MTNAMTESEWEAALADVTALYEDTKSEVAAYEAKHREIDERLASLTCKLNELKADVRSLIAGGDRLAGLELELEIAPFVTEVARCRQDQAEMKTHLDALRQRTSDLCEGYIRAIKTRDERFIRNFAAHPPGAGRLQLR